MNVEQITAVFGWMLLINAVLFLMGFSKITLFKVQTKRIFYRLFGDQSDAIFKSVPSVILHYYILFITFNLVPYAALRIVF